MEISLVSVVLKIVSVPGWTLPLLCCHSCTVLVWLDRRSELLWLKNNISPPLLLKGFLPELVSFPSFFVSAAICRVQDRSKNLQLLGRVRGL